MRWCSPGRWRPGRSRLPPRPAMHARTRRRRALRRSAAWPWRRRVLRGGGPPGLQPGDAIVGRPCEDEASFRGLDLGCGGLRALLGGKGCRARGTGTGREIAAVEHDERLAGAYPIARRYADVAHRRQDARRDRGCGACLHDAARVDGTGDVSHRNPGDGDRDGLAASAGAASALAPSIRPPTRLMRALRQRPQRGRSGSRCSVS